MIIKRNLKSQMPSLKRCRLGGDSSAAGDDDDNSSSDWKKRRANGYYPLNLLGEVAAGVIPVSPSKLHSRKGFAASWERERERKRGPFYRNRSLFSLLIVLSKWLCKFDLF
uniref:Uncharacterized protein MANES_14G006400 n=1 Tax=Rhizophora mucronata TaxID=61149 RepID=A0A2P2IP87_RHIMU